MHLHDAFVNPLPVISAESRQLIHAEPEQTVERELKAVLPFEFCENAVATRAFLECLEFIHRDETHVRTSCKPHTVNQPRVESRLDLAKVDANVISSPEQLLHQTFEPGFSRISCTVHKERLLHAPSLDVGKTRTDEFEQQTLNFRIPVRKRMHGSVECRRCSFFVRPCARNLYGGEKIGRVFRQLHRGEVQNAVLKVDDVLVCIEVRVFDVVQIRCEDAESLVHFPHLDEFCIVGRNAVLDESLEHIIRIETVHAAFINVAQNAMPCTVADEDVMQVLTDVVRECRAADKRDSLRVETDEFRVLHR